MKFKHLNESNLTLKDDEILINGYSISKLVKKGLIVKGKTVMSFVEDFDYDPHLKIPAGEEFVLVAQDSDFDEFLFKDKKIMKAYEKLFDEGETYYESDFNKDAVGISDYQDILIRVKI